MGLDQYAHVRRAEESADENAEIAYWRKHRCLQGWMENLYREKGGEQEFNCVEVEITREDLAKLASDLIQDNLPDTSGFFWGNRNAGDCLEEDFAFIAKALLAINSGLKVYYSSWW